MSVDIKISSKGQIVIPKDVREALRLEPGTTLRLTREGRRIVLESPRREQRERITYAEFRRRVPKYEGPPIAVEDMTSRIGELFRDWDG